MGKTIEQIGMAKLKRADPSKVNGNGRQLCAYIHNTAALSAVAGQHPQPKINYRFFCARIISSCIFVANVNMFVDSLNFELSWIWLNAI